MSRLLMWLSVLVSTLLLILSSFLFLGSTLHLLTTFTLGYFIQSLVWLGVMWFAVGSIEEYMKLLKG
jgi:hypothetical protein